MFWELSLIPAFFLIKLWGGTRRGPAATQFFVYTMAGSVALLVSFLAIFLSTGSPNAPGTMDFGQLTQLASTGALEQMVTAHLGPVTIWLAIGVLAGFAVKVPMIPFHTWLPAAYAEAPSPVTMLLTGAMSKMGVYGLLRIALPLFGHQISQMRTPLLVLAVATVVMGAWAAAAQKDLKRVFAYSSVNHLGYCLLGIFALAVPTSGAAASQPGRGAQRRHPASAERPYMPGILAPSTRRVDAQLRAVMDHVADDQLAEDLVARIVDPDVSAVDELPMLIPFFRSGCSQGCAGVAEFLVKLGQQRLFACWDIALPLVIGWKVELVEGKRMDAPVAGHVGKMAGEAAQTHGLGVRFVVEIGVGRDGSKHLAGFGGLGPISAMSSF